MYRKYYIFVTIYDNNLIKEKNLFRVLRFLILFKLSFFNLETEIDNNYLGNSETLRKLSYYD